MKKGFTLIEVCLVMLIFGVAVSSLMALFPVSLRQGNMAVSDSVVTTFAEGVLNALAANAAVTTDRTIWEDEAKFGEAVAKDVEVGELELLKKGGLYEGSSDEYLGIPKSYIGCQLQLEKETSPYPYGWRIYRATLRVKDIRSAPWTSAAVFVTYLGNMGEVP